MSKLTEPPINLINRLKENNFMPYWVESPSDAKKLFYSTILPEINPQVVAFADSLTLRSTNILDDLKSYEGIRFIDTFDKSLSWEERIERRRQALLVDLFLTGTNAITENGQLVNLDMIGNRVNGIVFGPRNVVLTIGINKIVKNVSEAKKRIKSVSAPLNAKRHETFDIPCKDTGYCMNCNSKQRICNVWSVIEKCFPKNRIRIILINEELGL